MIRSIVGEKGYVMKTLLAFLLGVLLLTSCVWTENLMATVPSSGAFQMPGASGAPFLIGSLITDGMALSANVTATAIGTDSSEDKDPKKPPPPPPPPPKCKDKDDDSRHVSFVQGSQPSRSSSWRFLGRLEDKDHEDKDHNDDDKDKEKPCPPPPPVSRHK